MASSDNAIWWVSCNAKRRGGTDQWRAKRRWPSQHNTSQPIPQRGMLIASAASGLKVRPRLWHAGSGQRTRRLTTWIGPSNVQSACYRWSHTCIERSQTGHERSATANAIRLHVVPTGQRYAIVLLLVAQRFAVARRRITIT